MTRGAVEREVQAYQARARFVWSLLGAFVAGVAAVLAAFVVTAALAWVSSSGPRCVQLCAREPRCVAACRAVVP